MKRKVMASLAAAVLLMVGGLAGCSNPAEESEKAAVCFVVANTANSKGLNFSSPLVQDAIYSAIRGYGYISVVNVDESPEVVFNHSFDIPDKYKNASSAKLETDAQTNAAEFTAYIQSVVADAPEVDYLEGLYAAVRSLSSLEGYDSKTIIVLGTGVGTCGALNLQNNLLSADPEEVVELLSERDEIPDFSGFSIYWQQLGDVALPQQELSKTLQNRLEELYGSIVEAGGGTLTFDSTMPAPVNEGVEYPAVTPVDFPADLPIYFDGDNSENLLEQPVVMDEKVTFIADEADYLDPEEALETLRPLAEFLLQHDKDLLLVGTTAGDVTDEVTLKLSQERADQVKASLVSLGVSESRLTAVGMGSEDPWHIKGAGLEGELAERNRKVVLLDAATDEAQTILEMMQS